MKRIKAIILSGAMLMAVVIVGNAAWAQSGDNNAADPRLVDTVVSNGGGMVDVTAEEAALGFNMAIKCNTYNSEGLRIGTTRILFQVDNPGTPEEKFVKGRYSITLDHSKQPGSVTVEEMTVMEAPFLEQGMISCLCLGSVTSAEGKWASVQSVQCNCAFEFDEATGGLKCKYCTCVLLGPAA